MIFKFLYTDNETTFETEADTLEDAIKKLKKLNGKLYNPNNKILNNKLWRINCSINVITKDELKMKDKSKI